MKNLNLFILFTLLITSVNISAQTGDAVHFIGTDGNWFEPSNWDSGVLPDATTDIVLTVGQTVVIDPTMSPTGMPIINDITLENATLTTLANTVFQYNKLIIDDTSLFDSRSSEIIGVELEINRNGTSPGPLGMKLNPTTNDNRSIKITAKSAKLQMFLGGTIAASPGNVGMGHYATLSANDIELDGFLEIDSIYDFQPRVGDIFQVITARNSLIGQFRNTNEGDVVARLNDLSLVISYRGGDGNDVVLTAVDDRNVFVGPGSDWMDPLNWSTGEVPMQTAAITVPAFMRLTDASVDVGSIDMDDADFELSNSSIKLFGWGYAKGTIKLNPSFILVNQMLMLDDQTALSIGLGGNQPASLINQGDGYYANIKAVDIQLNGTLDVFSIYDFEPSIGDEFKIIDVVGSQTGKFSNSDEGDVILSTNNVDLTLSYRGGDGNDVVLKALDSNDRIFRNGFEQ